MDIAEYRADKKKASEGVWFDVGKGTRWLIAQWGNEAYQRRIAELTRDMQPKRPAGRARQATQEMDADALAEAMRQAVAETIWLGWEGMQDRGKPVEYSVERALEYLHIPDIDSLVVGYAMDRKAYLEDWERKTSKN